MLHAANLIVKRAIETKKLIVMDGDALFQLSNEESITGYERAILTPNAIEFERLWLKYIKH